MTIVIYLASKNWFKHYITRGSFIGGFSRPTDLPRFINGYNFNEWALGEVIYREPQLPHGRVRELARQVDDWLIKDIPVEKWN